MIENPKKEKQKVDKIRSSILYNPANLIVIFVNIKGIVIRTASNEKTSAENFVEYELFQEY